MTPNERYDLLLLLHTYITERGTAALHVSDVVNDLALSITPDEFGFDRVRRSDVLQAQVTALLP